MNPPSTVLGGVHGKVCWLIAYRERVIIHTNISSNNQTTYTVKKLSSGTKTKAIFTPPNRKLYIDMFCENVRINLVANTDNTFG